ncbi:hypothetical protein LCGC14_0995820 [marine sediment metagenome]|uniref:Right handed beta helix domain-containing protein n=1 Tax=marine sediment metagenome TaxID=412755 RepID=A0A0F9N4H3_9ZZZZ
MGNAKQYIKALRMGHLIHPESMVNLNAPVEGGRVWFVDGDLTPTGNGKTWAGAYNTIAGAISAASAGDVIYIAAKTMSSGASDPSSYEENLTIPPAKSSLSLIGVSRGRAQGGLPQLKDGSTTTQEILRVRAPGCLIYNLGFNGAGNTGGGILLDESDAAYTAFGTSILGCHFKNCKGSTATNAATGGAIMWTSNGGAWQVLIDGNQFYKNVGDIVLKGTSGSVPQDVVIQNNTFNGTAGAVDCHILMGGSGMLGFTIDNNTFADLLPSLGSGTNVRYVILVGTGLFSNNSFAGVYTTAGFGAGKAAAKIPTTVGLPHNYTDGGLIVREA